MTLWPNDVAHALRLLAKSPAFTAAAVLSLAVGIGADTAIFSVADALLLRPLPYSDPDRIAIIWQRSPGLDVRQDWLSTGQYLDIALENTVFEHTAAAIGASFNLTGNGRPERVDGVRVSSSFFPLFGAGAALGTVFSAEHDRPGGAPVVILTHGFWERRFGSDPGVIGKTLQLNGNSFTIVGVMSPAFSFDKDVMPAVNGIQRSDLLLPLPLPPSARANRGGEDFNVFAKLQRGVTFERAQAEMDRVAASMRRQYPAMYPANGGLTLSVVPLADQVLGDLRPVLYVLLGAVALVLLLSCINVANLLLSRAAVREHELAIRTALGASRARIVRQLVTESVVLSLAGGGVGLGIAVLAVMTLHLVGPANVPRTADIHIDPRMLAFTAAVSLVAPLVFGLVPALRATRVDPNDALREGARGTSGTFGLRHERSRKLLIVAEVALSVVLLVGAGLLVRSYRRIVDADPGFDARNVLSFRLSLPGTRYKGADAVFGFYDRLTRRLQALPGVQRVGYNYQLPLSTVALAWEPIIVEGYVPKAAGDDRIITSSAYVSPGYLETMGIPLAQGRNFTEHDDKRAPEVVIVDDHFAARFWPNQNPIGKRIRQDVSAPWRTVVGVVSNTKEYELESQPPITAYFPVEQYTIGSRFVVMRTTSRLAASALLRAVTREIRAIDPDLPMYDVATMEQRLSDSLARRRLAMLVLAAFASFALFLSAIGTYGVIAFWVDQRRREIGIRMALGADDREIARLVGREFVATVGSGLVAGMVVAALGTRLMSSLLFGVGTLDRVTFVVVSLVILAAGLLATYVPTRRATRVEPSVALRV